MVSELTRTHAQLLLTRERLLVGRRFLMWRPLLALAGALGNGVCLAAAAAPFGQKLVLGLTLGGTVAAFFAERRALAQRALSERWLFVSLLLTLLVLAIGTLLSGGIRSPLLPLLFAPTVVGFAAFALRRESFALFAVTLAALATATWLGALPGFLSPPAPWGTRMLLISSAVALSLLALGVIGLVEAHARIALELDRMRADVLREAEQRAASMELLGAQVAHDVKNPLTAVRGLVQLVAQNSAERDRERLGVALGEIDRALSVLHGYLSWARPVRELAREECDVRAVLDDVASVVEARAAQRNVRLSVEGERVSAWLDRQRLRDALLNLALNAIDAMPAGGALGFALTTHGDELEICVRDTGRGMSDAELSRLGQAFVSDRPEGTGLGVLLARGAAEQHGGALRFQSAPGEGTRALISLPMRVGVG